MPPTEQPRRPPMIVRLIKALVTVLLLAAVGLFILVRSEVGQFAQLGPSTPLPVRFVTDEAGAPLVGAEDVAVDRVARRAYFSVYDRRAFRSGQAVHGHLYVMSLDDSGLRARDITPGDPKLFRPHGLDLFHEPGGAVALYVINHPGKFDDVVEIFDVAEDGPARHRETIADSAFVSLNDLVVVAPRQFYATNDHGFKAGFRRKLEDTLHTRDSSVVFFDGSVATPVARGLNRANGVAASRDGGEIYVAETYGRRLSVFRRDHTNGNLTLSRTIPVDTGPDNLAVDDDGSVWIGGHPQLYKAYAFSLDASHPSPSQAVRVDLAKPAATAAATVFLDDGTRLNSSTGAVPLGGRVLVSSVLGPAAVVTLGDDAKTAAGESP